MMGLLTGVAVGQTEPVASSNPNKLMSAASPKTVAQPAMTEIRGITLGITADEVKRLLGKPKVDDKDGFYYVLSDHESMQIRLDSDGKVNTASIIYTGADAKTPEADAVFGASADITPGTDGRIYELVRYPEAGFWVSYSRIMLENGPMTTITMQKL